MRRKVFPSANKAGTRNVCFHVSHPTSKQRNRSDKSSPALGFQSRPWEKDRGADDGPTGSVIKLLISVLLEEE